MNWQPIKTAPRNGDNILIWDGKDIGIGNLCDKSDDYYDAASGICYGVATHWMPLPQTPEVPQFIPHCECPDTYSIEPHGQGYALYFGACNHKHGFNLANITEPDMPRLNYMLQLLNQKLQEENDTVF